LFNPNMIERLMVSKIEIVFVKKLDT